MATASLKSVCNKDVAVQLTTPCSQPELLYLRAYDRAAVKMRGDKASLNFPATDYKEDPFLKVCSSCKSNKNLCP